MDLGYLITINNKSGIITSNYKYYFPYIAYTFSSILTLTSTVGFFGNIFTVLAVFTTKELNFEGNLFVVNLALADMVVSGFIDTMSIVGLLEGEVFFLDKYGFCRFIGSTCLTSCICSLFNICFVGINRFIFIVKNGLYRKYFTRRTCYFYCLVSWVLAFLCQMPNFLGWGGHTYDRKTLSCIYDRNADPSFTFFFAGFIVSLPVMVTSYCYIKIYLFWRQVSLKVASMSKQNKTNQIKSIKLAKMLFLLFFIYVLCWTPYAIVANVDRHDSFSEILHIFVVTFAHVNSSVNPILYGLSNQQFKEAYINLFRKLFCLKKKVKTASGHTTNFEI